jgi:FG-GAP repeat protein
MLARCLIAAAFLLAVTASDAHAALVCDPNDEGSPPLVIGDIDGDNVADEVAGVPERLVDGKGEAGAIAVRLSGGGTQVLTAASVAGVAESGDRLGAALAIGDVDGDGCADVLAGAPGLGDAGAVLVLRGSPVGIASAGATVLPGAAPGDRFGTAVALAQRPRSPTRDLWVGAPGADVGGKLDAGAVYHYTLDPGAGAPALVGVITEDSPGVPDRAEAGNRFGEVIAPAAGGALVGVPREDIGAREDAGAVVRLSIGGAGAQRFTLPRARAGDRFGAAVTTTVSGTGGMAGAPGRDLAGARDAGVVQLFRSLSGGRLAADDRLAQGVDGIPGRSERGDRFGAAMTSGRALLCAEATSFAVGAPGEDLGRVRDAGSVTVVEPGDIGCKPRALSQGRGLPGRPERGDRLGAALGIARDRDDFEEDASETLLAGAPGEAVQGRADAGQIETRSGAVGPARGRSLGFPAGPVAGLAFGSVLAAPAIGSTLD